MQAHWLRFLVPWACVLSLGAKAQSIEPVTQVLRLGDSLRIELRVRGFEIDPARLQADCLSAQISQGGEPVPEHAITIHTTPLADDGQVQVRLTSTMPVHEPVVHVRARVHCGADYAREFSLLADPAPATGIGTPAHKTVAARTRRNLLVRPTWPAPSRTRDIVTPQPVRAATTAVSSPDIERIAQAVALVLRQHLREPPMPADIAANSSTPSGLDELWQRELARLRDEQRQAHVQLASLQYKLDQTHETDRLRWLLMVSMAVLLLAMAALHRWWTERGLARVASYDSPEVAATADSRASARPRSWRLRERMLGLRTRQAKESRAPSPGLASAPPGIVGDMNPVTAPAPVSDWLEFDLAGVGTPAPSTALDTTTERSQRWEHADFGCPSLEAPAHAQWLHQVDELARTGYHGAALAVFEHALHGMPVKPAWLLLRLLDLYAALNQPANHDRVAAELEALYNIRIPALHARPDDDPPLELRSDLMPQICSLWREPGAVARLLEGWLLAAPGHARLGMNCFRDALMLHDLARELAASDATQPLAA